MPFLYVNTCSISKCKFTGFSQYLQYLTRSTNNNSNVHMAQPPFQASAEEMAAHDRQAWRRLDMADIQQKIERAEHTGDDGIIICPLASRRIYQCRHYFSLFEMLMNVHAPIPDEALATRACPACSITVAIQAWPEVEEDRVSANYSDA
jgi:hypothetical protein